MSRQNGNFDNDLELELSPTAITSDVVNDYRAVKKNKLPIIIGAVVMLLLISYGLTMLVSNSSPPRKAVELTDTDVRYEHHGLMFDFPEIVTNLAPSGDKDAMIKLVMVLEVSDTKNLDVIDQKLATIKDAIIVFLREVRMTDLTSSGGSLMLKTELIRRINKVLYPIELKDILFKEIFIN